MRQSITEKIADFEEHMQKLNQKARQDEILEKEKEEEEARERAKKNDNFYMVFKNGGSQKVRELLRISAPAAEIFMFLAEQADRTNAVVASGRALATYLKMSDSMVSRALKILSARVDDKGNDKEPYLELIKSGGTNVFILNPEIVWSAWKTGKDYCLFGNAKILVSTGEQDLTVRKRLNVILEKNKQLELPMEENNE